MQHRASPRNAHAFTGFSGNSTRDGPGGPSGTLLLAVTNSAIPCTLEGMSAQKFVSFTVLNIRKKGWIYAPWCVISVFYSRLSRDFCMSVCLHLIRTDGFFLQEETSEERH